ncbi:MAG: hypothetical protein L6Q83_11475 [Gammaproteobacteria bacterium]|nr:hypothetical protein [Gammaproteobacteria bacterium]
MLALLAAAPAGAQEDRSQQALARAQALLRQVSGQKQELETANARLTAEIDALERKLGAAESGLKRTGADLQAEQRKAERVSGALDDNRARLERTEAALREAKTRLNEANEGIRRKDEAIASLEGRLAATEDRLADSERKNLQLYEANVELLALYRNKGAWSALLQREPTGLKNVEIENVLQEYRLKLDDSLTEGNQETLRGGTSGKSDEE